ncbi:MAG: hypothetical protein ACREQP_01195 [Candidatus Binatia bacterium]
MHDLAEKKPLAALLQREQIPGGGDGDAERDRDGKMEPLDEGEIALGPLKDFLF